MKYRQTVVHYEFAAQDKLNTNIITTRPTASAGTSDTFIFPKLKTVFKGRRFNDITLILAKLQDIC
jgi:hypothetical protein